jgi:hypothetical protein
LKRGVTATGVSIESDIYPLVCTGGEGEEEEEGINEKMRVLVR